MRCGGKWSRDHQCPAAVQLHVVQELLDVFREATPIEAVDSVQAAEPEQLFLSLLVAAVTGMVQPRTMCFWGLLGDQHVKILLDSGSSNTLISSVIASGCPTLQQLPVPLKVQVANGQVITCSSHIPDASWSIQGYQFSLDLKVLPLSSYDMILGLDWLEAHSSMEVHWARSGYTSNIRAILFI